MPPSKAVTSSNAKPKKGSSNEENNVVQELIDLGRGLVKKYRTTTPTKLKILDAFLVYALATALLVCIYCFLVGSFPFNSFLAGLLCQIGVFVLTVSLRFQQVTESHEGRSVERAFVDYIACVLILFLVVINFMG